MGEKLPQPTERIARRLRRLSRVLDALAAAPEHQWRVLMPSPVQLRAWASLCLEAQGRLIDVACDCETSGNVLKPKQHGADPHAKNCAIYLTSWP